VAKKDGVIIMKANLLWCILGILMLFGACSKPKEVLPEMSADRLRQDVSNMEMDTPESKDAEDDSLEAVYIRYIEKYGGDIRTDFALVGPVELVLNLNDLSKEVKEKIEYISIESRMEDVPEIIGLHNLKTVQLYGLGIKRVENLKNLKVDNISLVVNPLESIAPLGENQFIKRLNLSSSGLKHLPDMSGMKNLRVLGLLRSKIVSLDNIQTIPNSIDLNILECDELEDIDALRFAKIKRLYISKDGINSIGGQGDTKGLYDKNKDWFDKYLPQLKGNEPEFEMFFYMKEE
jgi:hypothetical protein